MFKIKSLGIVIFTTHIGCLSNLPFLLPGLISSGSLILRGLSIDPFSYETLQS